MLGLSILLAGPSQAEPLTIGQAVQEAIGNAFVVRLGEKDVARADQLFREADGLLRPQLNMTGSYTRTDGSGTASFGTPGQGGSTVGGLNEFKQFQVTASNVIDLTGAARNGVVARRLQRDSAQETLNAQVNTVKNLVRSQYFTVLQSVALVTVQQDELLASRERLKNTRVRHEAGAVSKFDVLRLETEEKRSEQALVDAEGNLSLAKQGLNNVLGRPIDTQFDAVDVPEIGAIDTDYGRALKLAYANRPEIRSGEFSFEAFMRIRKLQQGGSLPVITVGATWTRVIDPFPGQKANSAQAFLQFTIPLYTSGVTRARTESARQDEERSRINLEQIKHLVSLDVLNALTKIETASKAYEVALKGRELATESLRLAQLRYDEGAGILLDVTTSQTELTRAQGSVVTAKYQYLTAVASLQAATGTDDLTAPKGAEAKVS
ncbi:MAG: TolC family protein [Armatimonadetes bacterium]|nr:TolC family protein [Armatimonadota bacterium]